MKLRAYQEELVGDIREAFKQHRNVLAVLPTGGGKTVVFTEIAKGAVSRGKKVLVLVHRVELLRQAYGKMKDAGLRTGLINPKYTPDYKADVQVASVQTLVRRLNKFPHFDLIISDEAHHATASTWKQIFDAYQRAFILGVTATPIRAGGESLGRQNGGLFDIMVEGPQITDLIALGYLVKPRVFCPPTKVDLSGVKTLKRTGDYDTLELAARVDKPQITGDAVAHYRKLADRQPCVVFCVSVAHAQHVAEEFRHAGYNAYALDGSLDDKTRSDTLRGLGNGKVHVVTSCDIISEGTDIPAIGCAILLRPTQSTGLYLQQVGRALRTLEGKSHATILDHVGNTFVHGLPDDFRLWTLDGVRSYNRKKEATDEEKPLANTQCEHCYAIFPKAPKCPACGTEVAPKTRKLKSVEGELEEYKPDPQAEIQRQLIADQKLKGALLKQAKRFGRSPAWVEAKFKAIKEEQAAKEAARERAMQARLGFPVETVSEPVENFSNLETEGIPAFLLQDL